MQRGAIELLQNSFSEQTGAVLSRTELIGRLVRMKLK